MANYCNFSYILLILLVTISLGYSQTVVYITEPQLISISPVNSTSLTVTWQFLNDTYDQSDLILISIGFYEFIPGYNSSYISTNYTYTRANKSVTSLTKNFELVNAFYYVCFSSNSSKTNVTQVVSVTKCQLTRTCLRMNSSLCPSATFVIILPSDISTNSFIITVYWLKKLPYSQNSTTVRLIENNLYGTALSRIDNDTYTSVPFRFSGLQSGTNYTISTIITYTIFNDAKADMYNLTVTTSRSLKLVNSGDMLIFGASIFSIFLIKF